MADLTGKTLGKYQILEKLGRGGMAQVYKGYHPSLQRTVAVKVMLSYLDEGPDPRTGTSFRERFMREARAAAALRHPNIVQVFDFDSQDDAFYMVMEYIEGSSLQELLRQFQARREVIPLATALRIFEQTASALSYAHEHSMLHRDIKPSNIMIDQKGQAYLTDFGIAQIMDQPHLTMTGTLMGTPQYMSPEQGKGQPLTQASDVYSLGITFYELLTCRVPFDADTPLAVIQQQISDPPPAPRLYRSDLPLALEKAVLKALFKAPEFRYQTVSDFLSAVQKACPPPAALKPETQTLLESATIIEAAVQAPLVHEPAIHGPAVQPPKVQAAYTPPGVPVPGAWTPPPAEAPSSKPSWLSKLSLPWIIAIVAICAALGIVAFLIGSKLMSGGTPVDTNVTNAATNVEESTPAGAETSGELGTATLAVGNEETPLVEATNSEEALPTDTPVVIEPPTEAPSLIVPEVLADKNYYCRQSPDPNSEEHWIFPNGATAPLLGKSNNDWWLIGVDDPQTRTKCCWVAGGVPSGDLDTVPVITGEIDRMNCPPAPQGSASQNSSTGAQSAAPAQGGVLAKSPNDGAALVQVPAGTFTMGTDDDPQAWPREKPAHDVYLDEYWMDQTEVTVGMFNLFVQQTGSSTNAEQNGYGYIYDGKWVEVPGANWQDPFGAGEEANPMLPATQVSWFDAQSYCNWAGRRLPTEAEWEKAARGTDTRRYPWGNENPNANLLKFESTDGATGVGSYPMGASPYGIFDLAGNVYEWVSDWYQEDYFKVSPNTNPQGPASGQYRVMKGGGWNSNAKQVRITGKDVGEPQSYNSLLGFRCTADGAQ
jgi:serine/threonine protein kinase/formylglycine-generating enzyme required for sulfatase activity